MRAIPRILLEGKLRASRHDRGDSAPWWPAPSVRPPRRVTRLSPICAA